MNLKTHTDWCIPPQKNQIWIALYTRARHEVRIAKQILNTGIETFVPLRKEIHYWSDRRKWIEVPLIPSYVFVKIDLREYFKLFAVPGILHVVMFRGRIARIRDHEIELLRNSANSETPVKVSSQEYRVADEVEIVSGIFAGNRGRVVQCGMKCKIGIRIEELEYALVIEIPKSEIRLINQTTAAG